MKTKGSEKKSTSSIQTPLEFIGFGFLIVLIGGLLFSAYYFRHYETLDDWYQKFSELTLIPYVIIGGPFILYGIIKGLDAYSKMSLTEYLTPTAVLFAHWVAIPICIKFSLWYSLLAFIVVCAIGILLNANWKKKKDTKNHP